MSFQLPSVRVFPWPQSAVSTPEPARNTERSTPHSLACRLVQIILAVYLIPAVLIVFLVGALGIMIVGVARILLKLQGPSKS